MERLHGEIELLIRTKEAIRLLQDVMRAQVRRIIKLRGEIAELKKGKIGSSLTEV